MYRYLLPLLLLMSQQVFAQDMQRVHKHIDTLCSPYMAGRGYVDGGDHKAALFIKDQFEKAELDYFEDGYFQHFSFPVNTFPTTLKLQLDKKKLNIGSDYIMNPVSSSGKGRKKIFYLDTLLFSDATYQKEFLKTKLKNKVLVYNRKDYKALTKLPVKFIEKVYTARAVIECRSKLTASISSKATKDCIFEVKDTLLDSRPKRAKFAVENVVIDKHKTQNIVGYIKGMEEPEKYIVISAHYDHLGKMGSAMFPGANDNASGTSMLIEFAHYFQQNPHKYSIVFIAFAGEEAGLLGSKYFTEHPLFPLKDIKFLLNLDIVGTGGEGITIVNGAVYKEAFDTITKLNDEGKYLKVVKKRGAAANSDHYFFYKNGVPSFFIYTMGGIQAYHDVFDKKKTLPLTAYPQLFTLITKFFETF